MLFHVLVMQPEAGSPLGESGKIVIFELSSFVLCFMLDQTVLLFVLTFLLTLTVVKYQLGP